jgi:hypothetical protein
VSLKREVVFNVTNIRGYKEDPDESIGETKPRYMIEFTISKSLSGDLDTVPVGETIKITGTKAGEYLVFMSSSGLVKCINNKTEIFDSVEVSGTQLEATNPNIKSRKIVFGITSGTDVKNNDDSEFDDNDYTSSFNSRVARFNSSKYSRFPSMLWGFLLTTSDKLQNNIDNNNGSPVDFGQDWEDYIQSVTVSHNESGTTGSLVLDKYGMTQFCEATSSGASLFEKQRPQPWQNILMQKVDALSLDVEFTNTAVDQEDDPKSYAVNLSTRDDGDSSADDFFNDVASQSSSLFTTSDNTSQSSGSSKKFIGISNWRYNQPNLGLLFRGVVYGQGVGDNVSSNEMTVPLYGIQRKLEEIKIVNAPYFDGCKIVDVLKYLAKYGNVCMNLENADPDARLPASSQLSVALVDFKLGTSVWDALHQVAEMTGHTFILQPDGVIWWYEIDNVNGLPIAKTGHQLWSYPNTRVVNSSLEPDFSQFYNHIILLALQAPTNSNVNNTLEKIDMPTAPLIAGARLKNTNPTIPWSKLLVVPLLSYWTKSGLNAEAYRYAKRAQSVFWNGSTEIPGNLAVKLFDTFTNNTRISQGSFKLGDDNTTGGEFLVVGISHTVDMVSKSFMTQLQLSMLGNSWYDPDGKPKMLDD